jgi:hypothetical protein
VVSVRSLALASLTVVLAFADDRVHKLAASNQPLAYTQPYGYLPGLLEALHIPVESQIAVFSKTSIQSLRIEPSNPRVIYFNDSVAAGWVRGGFIELAAPDPAKGVQFYTIQQRPDEHLEARQNCMSCHHSSTALLRSVSPRIDGVPAADSDTDVDSRTPLAGLWGGWFVTGQTLPAHAGNAVFEHGERRAIAPAFDAKFALTNSSDIVALMVFAHQMRVWNLFTLADYVRPDSINDLVDALLFIGDAPLPAPIRGDSRFAENFAALGPRDQQHRSLRDFDLDKRLMRYPCSYLIYSDAFDALTPATKDAVYRRLWNILSGAETSARYQSLSPANRKAVVEILRETKPDLPAYFSK